MILFMISSLCHPPSPPPFEVSGHYANKTIRRGKHPTGWIVVDEISMVDVACWAQLSKLAFCGLKWILVGDWCQYQPINDRWCGQPLAKSFEHSSLLHTMAGGNSCRLTENHRSDQRLFDFCGSLCPGGSRSHLPIKEMVAAARAEFPATKRKADSNLCISHAKRRRLSKKSRRKVSSSRYPLASRPTPRRTCGYSQAFA